MVAVQSQHLILLAWQANETAFERMPPDRRMAVLLVLCGLVLVGALMMTLAWWGARMVRRYMNPSHRFRVTQGRSDEPHEEDWASKPLMKSEFDD